MPVPRMPIAFFIFFLVLLIGGLPLLAAVALQVVHGVDGNAVSTDRVLLVHHSPAFWVRPPKPKPRRAGAATAGSASGAAETADASPGVTGAAAPKPRLAPPLISSALLTLTVDCSAW